MDLRTQLQATLGDAYTLERELRGGGMSRVFVAEESALRRKVVVKVLSPELAAGISAERFRREVLVAASLQQANIVPLHTAGEVHPERSEGPGLPYYTMPFVEGESLRARLSEKGALPVAEAVSIMRDVAKALAYSHERGIVHRDIKPDNVLLSGGTAVVTDFGIAKAIAASRTETGADSLTQTGLSLGTPAYMAPEQAAGEEVDHRADLYSLGILGYEMLAGRHPFASRRNARQMIGAQLGERPTPLNEIRAELPRALSAVVMACLEKDPGHRPQSARELLAALDAVGTPTGAEHLARGNRRYLVAAAVVIVVLLGGVSLFATIARIRAGSGEGLSPLSLAVLPFANVGGDSAQDYLADGMSDELTTAMGKISGVQVAARTSAYHYRGKRDVDAREVGRALGVRYVLQGTVRRMGAQLRVSAQLADATKGKEIWSESVTRDAKDVFAMQDDITRAITEKLQLQLGGATLAAAVSAPAQGTANPDAYDLYQRGEFLLRRRGAGVRLSAENFDSAIVKDGNFARAYAGLSAALELFPYFVGTSADAVYERATSAAKRALAIDSSLAEPHTSLGLAYMHALRWDAAESEFRHALALDPSDASVRLHYSRYLTYRGRLPEAIAQLERAKALDPYSAVVSSWLAALLFYTSHLDAALAEGRRAFQLDSTNTTTLNFGASINLAAGRIAVARDLADRLPQVVPWIGFTAYIRGASGDRASAARILHEVESRKPRPWLSETNIALVQLALGDTSAALAALERATIAHELWAPFLPLSDPMFDSVRKSARFAALVTRVGLDPNAFTTPVTRKP